MKILIFGRPGTGKSVLAEPFSKLINGVWLNSDNIRERYDDFDVTLEGKTRQAHRLNHLADGVIMAGKIAVIDFNCPTNELRQMIGANYTVWMDTIVDKEDTFFEFPDNRTPVNYHVSAWFDDTDQQLLNVVNAFMASEHHNKK